MWITAYFSNNGIPATGLSATIRIIDVADNSPVVTDIAMLEVGNGFYKYAFSTYDAEKDYAIRCDGSNVLNGNDRYTYGGNEMFDNVLNNILGLSQQNYRIFSPVYDGNNNMTSCTVKIYPTAADTNNDTNELNEYTMTATFNGDSEMLTYKVVQV